MPDRARQLLGDKLALLLAEIRRLPGFAPLSRVSVALYDAHDDILRTFSSANLDYDPLDEYEVRLSTVPSLAVLASGGTGVRIVDDLANYGSASANHTAALRTAGLRSSMTVPIGTADTFLGFVFFNAAEVGFFTPDRVRLLEPFTMSILKMVAKDFVRAVAV
ncbi:MAG: GAF domain-containing protein [Actinomycetota bacterium]